VSAPGKAGAIQPVQVRPRQELASACYSLLLKQVPRELAEVWLRQIKEGQRQKDAPKIDRFDPAGLLTSECHANRKAARW
jgi:hypothetical protein